VHDPALAAWRRRGFGTLKGVRGARRIPVALAVSISVLLAGSTAVAVGDRLDRAPRAPGLVEPVIASPPATLPVAVAPPPTSAEVTPSPTPAPAPPPPPRSVSEQPWIPFATVGPVVLHHPSSRVERVGFHESNHDGARALQPVEGAVAATVLETRERGTPATSAADVVADPSAELRSPVTGTVKRAGTYVLYCDNRDSYLVIEPDSRPGWEVKMLHIQGLQVAKGDRVVAGETVVALRPTQLPFESQVDELGPQPAWPHVHLEVVDPSIPDRPSPDGGC